MISNNDLEASVKLKTVISAVLATAVATSASISMARENISVVGSSTVYPFSTVVAERFGKISKFSTPTVESTGSGGGLKLFCQGLGPQTPDITNSSRRIKKTEVELCASNGVNDILEVLIGYDGIVLANATSAEQVTLSRKDIFLALAKDIPNPDGSESWIPNPYQTWKDVNPVLVDAKIEVLGPPPTSGTRDAFVELAMEGGCKSFGWVKALKKQDKKAYKARCHTIREDGRFVEAGENDNLIVQKLDANPKALGIFGFSFLDQNSDMVQGSIIDGNEPTFEAIASGDYPVSRPLYFYVKKAHIGQIPGLEGFIAEFINDRATGEEGYLLDKGLIPLGEDARAAVVADVKAMKSLSVSGW